MHKLANHCYLTNGFQSFTNHSHGNSFFHLFYLLSVMLFKLLLEPNLPVAELLVSFFLYINLYSHTDTILSKR